MLMMSFDDALTRANFSFVYFLQFYLLKFFLHFSMGGLNPSNPLWLRHCLAFSYIGSVTARISTMGISQTLWRSVEGAPPIFGSAAITLGIGPHSGLRRVYNQCTKTAYVNKLSEHFGIKHLISFRMFMIDKVQFLTHTVLSVFVYLA